jgi:K+-sensing histidine kinase KdpD
MNGENVMDVKVLVWVTSPHACKVILNEAKRYADRTGGRLIVVSIQSPITSDWAGKLRDLEMLNRAAKEFDAELTVQYSDNTLKAAYNIIKNIEPTCMFTGIPEAGMRSAFVENICSMAEDTPVYTVDKHGNAGRVNMLGNSSGEE